MSNEIVVSENSFIAPVVDIQSAVARYKAFNDFVSHVLKKDTDYGTVPGTGDKPALLKPGAEKLSTFFGLRPDFEPLTVIEDWSGKDHGGEPFFYYRYKCKMYRNGELVGDGIGSCNSFEKKYRYRWVNEMDLPADFDTSKYECRDGSISEFTFAIEKAETTGKYGKPKEYWQKFRDAIADGSAKHIQKKTRSGQSLEAIEIGGKLYAVPNKDVADQVNTIDKMAQKRALVAAVLITTNASDYFTQDIEDMFPDDGEQPIEGKFKDADTQEPDQKQVTNEQQKLANKSQKVERPMPPETLAEAISKKAMLYHSNPKFQEIWNSLSWKNAEGVQRTARDKFVWEISQLSHGDDNIRHEVSIYLFGTKSSKDIDEQNIVAALDWMGFWVKEATGEHLPGKYVQQEFDGIVQFLADEIKSNGDPVDLNFDDQPEEAFDQ